MYMGWIIYGREARKCEDKNDSIQYGTDFPVGSSYPTHYRIVSKEYKTKDDLDKALNNSFSKFVYKEIFDNAYVMQDGKLYCRIEVGDGGDWYPSKLKLEIISANNSVCKFKISEYFTDEEISNGYGTDESGLHTADRKFTMYKINGKWLITEKFSANEQIYNNNVQWLD